MPARGMGCVRRALQAVAHSLPGQLVLAKASHLQTVQYACVRCCYRSACVLIIRLLLLCGVHASLTYYCLCVQILTNSHHERFRHNILGTQQKISKGKHALDGARGQAGASNQIPSVMADSRALPPVAYGMHIGPGKWVHGARLLANNCLLARFSGAGVGPLLPNRGAFGSRLER